MASFGVRKVESYQVPSFSTGTDAEIAEALQKHYAGEIDLTEFWAVGDERTISLSAMSATGVGESHVAQNVTFVIMNVGGKKLSDGVTDCAFIVGMKDVLQSEGTMESGYLNSANNNAGGWDVFSRRTWCNSVFYNAIPSSIRPIFKQYINKTGAGSSGYSTIVESADYFALASEKEVLGFTTRANAESESQNNQFDYYKTAANRIKYQDNARTSNVFYWTRSPAEETLNYYGVVILPGAADSTMTGLQNAHGISPFGCI